MHLRFTKAVGTPVVDQETLQPLGSVSGILIHPDTGKIEGFFVAVTGFLHSANLFLPTIDILQWGARVTVSHADRLAPLEDHVRLRSLVEEQRTLLGQSIRTDTGRSLGKCADVQFDTAAFRVEWLFPKTIWKWGLPIAVTQILEVRKDAIIVRDPSTPAPEKSAIPGVQLLGSMPDAA